MLEGGYGGNHQLAVGCWVHSGNSKSVEPSRSELDEYPMVCLEIYAGEVLVRRFIHIDKLSTLNPLKGLLFRDPIVMAMVFWMLI